MIKVQPYQSVCLLRSCGTDGSRERFVRVLYGKVCSEAVRHENHAGLKLLSLRQKQQLSPGSYGISYKLGLGSGNRSGRVVTLFASHAFLHVLCHGGSSLSSTEGAG